MIKTESNKDLIAEIKGGIKKEVSTSCMPEKMICNICNTDNMAKYCRHWPGREYTIEDGSAKGTKKRCKMLLHGAKEAYELSFVAVPAQPRASTHKCEGFAKPVEEKEDTPEVTPDINIETNNNETKDAMAQVRFKALESFYFAQKERGGKENE
jgi:hypothetical protein